MSLLCVGPRGRPREAKPPLTRVGDVLRAQLLMAACAAGGYVLACAFNQWLFSELALTRAIHWIYLPAGVRLLAVLLFGSSGALGLVLGGWVTGLWVYFPGNSAHSLVAALVSAGGPYLVYRAARCRYGLEHSLARLTAGRLLALALACSLVTPLLHHAWFLASGQPADLRSLGVMFIGDLVGTLCVLYGIHVVLLLVPRRAR